MEQVHSYHVMTFMSCINGCCVSTPHTASPHRMSPLTKSNRLASLFVRVHALFMLLAQWMVYILCGRLALSTTAGWCPVLMIGSITPLDHAFPEYDYTLDIHGLLSTTYMFRMRI